MAESQDQNDLLTNEKIKNERFIRRRFLLTAFGAIIAFLTIHFWERIPSLNFSQQKSDKEWAEMVREFLVEEEDFEKRRRNIEILKEFLPERRQELIERIDEDLKNKEINQTFLDKYSELYIAFEFQYKALKEEKSTYEKQIAEFKKAIDKSVEESEQRIISVNLKATELKYDEVVKMLQTAERLLSKMPKIDFDGRR